MTVWFNDDSLYYFYDSKAQIKSKNHHNMSVVVCRFIHFDSPQFCENSIFVIDVNVVTLLFLKEMFGNL